MKYIKLYESFENIDSICEKYYIKNYTINSDGTVDVDGNIYLSRKKLIKLPLKFGKVGGYFNCGVNSLTTLEGSPQSVGGSFHCEYNDLATLEGSPQSVGGKFDCYYNRLITLKGGPKSVGDFMSSNNLLTSLEFCPQSVGGNFCCSNNKLITLEGCPHAIGNITFLNNELKDLYGFPEFFDGDFSYDNNPVGEILDLFKTNRIGKVIDLLNEYDVIQQDGKLVILDRLEEVFHTLNMKIPKINLKNYEVY